MKLGLKELGHSSFPFFSYARPRTTLAIFLDKFDNPHCTVCHIKSAKEICNNYFIFWMTRCDKILFI